MIREPLLRRTRRILLLASVLTFPADSAFPGGDSANVEIQKLTLFKNGLGFIVSSAELPENAKTVRIGQLPIPSFGTFWVGYPKEVRVQSLLTSMDDVERSAPAQNIGQLLLANAGRRVTVHTADRDIEGLVMAASPPEGAPLVPSPYFMSPRVQVNPYNSYVPPTPQSEVLLIKTEKGTVALNPGSVMRAEFADRDPIATVSYRAKSPSLRLQLEKPAGGEKVTISYLAHGVTWVPGYLIDLSDPKTARVSAHAEIINEMTDFRHVSLQLVTGFPNLKFGEILSPVAMSQTLSDFLRALSGGGSGQEGNRSMLLNQAAGGSQQERFDADLSSLVPGYSTAAEGLVAEDLFFYPVKDFSLKKFETAWIPLFTAEMSYKHVYTWKIVDYLDENDHYRAGAVQGDRKKSEEVWHSCRLVNNLTMPLTTASAEFVSNGEFTGQDICYYTAPKSETTIRINKALNILADQGETEVERKRDASVIHGYHYDLVKIRGELKVGNKTDRTVSVEITKEISGEVLETVPAAGDVKTARGLKQVNPKHILTWVVQLNPGEEKNLSYQYQVWFRE